MTKKKKRVLIGSPVRQTPAILQEFLASLLRLEKNTYTADYLFFDDNTDQESSKLLRQFFPGVNPLATIISEIEQPSTHYLANQMEYVCDESGHKWGHGTMLKVGAMKDRILQYARENHYDYVFLSDSDMVFHPKTLEQLLSANKDIVCTITWTKWGLHENPAPQVWLVDEYTQYYGRSPSKLSTDERIKLRKAFYDQLKKPGIYEVGGLAACTLISKQALKKGISFKPIKNISMHGEDRNFCIRAVVLDLELYVDTHYPAYHIFRLSDLAELSPDMYK
jgi:hypothetical protein